MVRQSCYSLFSHIALFSLFIMTWSPTNVFIVHDLAVISAFKHLFVRQYSIPPRCATFGPYRHVFASRRVISSDTWQIL